MILTRLKEKRSTFPNTSCPGCLLVFNHVLDAACPVNYFPLTLSHTVLLLLSHTMEPCFLTFHWRGSKVVYF
jgi:hypothetical protein